MEISDKTMRNLKIYICTHINYKIYYFLQSNKYAMYIIVPNSLTGLPRVLNSLSEIRSEMNNLHEHVIDVTLPKFKFEYMSRLNSILREVSSKKNAS